MHSEFPSMYLRLMDISSEKIIFISLNALTSLACLTSYSFRTRGTRSKLIPLCNLSWVSQSGFVPLDGGENIISTQPGKMVTPLEKLN